MTSSKQLGLEVSGTSDKSGQDSLVPFFLSSSPLTPPTQTFCLFFAVRHPVLSFRPFIRYLLSSSSSFLGPFRTCSLQSSISCFLSSTLFSLSPYPYPPCALSPYHHCSLFVVISRTLCSLLFFSSIFFSFF